MGYRYYYSMHVDHISIDEANKITAIFDNHSGYMSYSVPSENGFCFMLDNVQWANPLDALQEISCKMPNKVFELSYSGDEWDDRGSIFAKDGRTQTCHIVVSYPEPDEFFKK